LNGRVLKASRIASTMHEIRIDNRGVLLVQVGNKAFKVAK
jgi:oligosaccharide reducing-end xylanase